MGGKIFELKYLGIGHGEDLIAVGVQPENIAFIVDLAKRKRRMSAHFNSNLYSLFQK